MTTVIGWPTGHPTAPPPAGEVHLYLARLDPDPAEVAAFEATLSPAERALANRRVTEDLRRRAVVSRGLLRRCLATTLDQPPESFAFAMRTHGKPFLAGKAQESRIDFSISHTGELWLLALVDAGPIGVDIETPRDETDWDALTERYFSEDERERFRALSAERRRDAFFQTWTRKEAFLKAVGTGLATPLAAFDVEIDPEKPAALQAWRHEEESAEAWWIADIDGVELPDGSPIPGALAGRAPLPSILRWQLEH